MVSIDIGPVHLISFNSEYYYYVSYGWEQIIRQYEWLEEDLKVSKAFRFYVWYQFILQITWK